MKIMEKVKTKAINLKVKVCDFYEENADFIFSGACFAILGGLVIFLKGYSSGVKYGRSEWDFGNDKGEWAVLLEEDGEFRTALPIAAIREVMEKHHTKTWDDSMWRKLDR